MLWKLKNCFDKDIFKNMGSGVLFVAYSPMGITEVLKAREPAGLQSNQVKEEEQANLSILSNYHIS